MTSDVSPLKIGIECAAWFPKRKKRKQKDKPNASERKPEFSDADSPEFPPPGLTYNTELGHNRHHGRR
jgi:hypothetical protein